MRIALCDADKTCIRETKNLLYQYANNHRLDFLVDEFCSGELLLSSREKYDIAFLEYNTQGLNGFETSKILRKKSNNTTIIFISSYTGFILESFKVNPFRFLIKPVSTNLLFSTLDEYFEKHGSDYPLWIKDGDNTFCLNTNEIFFLEADNKHCFVNLRSEKISCHKTMAKVYETLPKNHFHKINRAFIINFNYIARYNNNDISLSNGCNLHISRKYLKEFKMRYRDFLNPREP